jgi:DivIVA domain-containing protein
VTTSRADLLARLRDLRLPVVRWREGYRTDDVDDFLDRVSASLLGNGPAVTAGDVHEVRFTPVRLTPGYDMRAVDDLLDEIVAVLESRPG